MGKSNITLPPQKKIVSPTPLAADEKKISAVINKGGGTTKADKEASDVLKNFNIKLLSSELDAINDLRNQMPKPRGKRMAISLHDWIVMAVNEKLQRDSETNNT
jgi:hypothetical protein